MKTVHTTAHPEGTGAALARTVGVLTLLCVLLPIAIVVGAAAWFLLGDGETTAARVAGAGSLLALAGFALHAASWGRWSGPLRRGLGSMCLVLALACLVLCGILAPRPPAGGARFQSVWTPASAFSRWSPVNLLPEVDQLKLGSRLFPLVDPYLDTARAARLRGFIVDIHAEMRGESEFGGADSALGECYREMFGRPSAGEHQFVYRPAGGSTGPRPVLVFLHGSLGNFQSYSWVLKQLADRLDLVVIAPTCGAGNWWKDTDGAILRRVHEQCVADPGLDESRVWLAALSNGGTGLTRAVAAAGERYRGLLLLSCVMEPRVYSADAFSRGVAGKPVLVLHGEADERIPVAQVRAAASFLRGSGARVTAWYPPGEDHFLFFSRRGEIVDRMEQWFRAGDPASFRPR